MRRSAETPLQDDMANKRPKKDLFEAPAPVAPVLPVSTGPPARLQYKPMTDTRPWRVEKFEELAAEFGLTAPFESAMAKFHEAAQGYSRGWLIARRLYGIAMLIPDAATHPDDLRSHTRPEICTALGIPGLEELQAELTALRVFWEGWMKAPTMEAPLEKEAAKEIRTTQEEFKTEEQMLRAAGFNKSMFEITVHDEAKKEDVPRSPDDNAAEMEWFVKRISDPLWQMMLNESMSSATAREALLNELYLRRVQNEMIVVSPTTSRFKNLRSIKQELETTFQQQMAALQEQFPERDIAKKMSARVTVASLVKALVEYKSKKSNQLIDGIRTAHEIDVDLTGSKQVPIAPYRQGQTMFFLESIHHMFDPNYRSQLRPATLRKFDIGLPRWMEQARQELGEPLVDLEHGVMPGDGDDFEDFANEEEKIANQ